MKKNKRVFIAIICITFLGVAVIYGLAWTILSDERINEKRTEHLMASLKTALLDYRQKCGEFPAQLEEVVTPRCSEFLPLPPENLEDSWGNKFIYYRLGDGDLKIISIGRAWLEVGVNDSPHLVEKPR